MEKQEILIEKMFELLPGQKCYGKHHHCGSKNTKNGLIQITIKMPDEYFFATKNISLKIIAITPVKYGETIFIKKYESIPYYSSIQSRFSDGNFHDENNIILDVRPPLILNLSDKFRSSELSDFVCVDEYYAPY